jgi:flagellar biosynthesis component FlhA
MHEDNIPNPSLNVHLSFSSSLDLQGSDGSLAQSYLITSIEHELNSLLAVLGIPGFVSIALASPYEPKSSDGQFFRYFVNDHRLRFSDELLLWTYAYVTQNQENANCSLQDIGRWICSVDLEDKENEDACAVREFFCLTARDIFQTHAQYLIGLPQAEAYLSIMMSDANFTSPDGIKGEWLNSVLQRVISMGISLSNFEKINQALFDTLNLSPSDAAEVIISKLRPQIIELQFPEGYLRTLTESSIATERLKEVFPFMRDDLFVELGVKFPNFQFQICNDIKPGCFSIKINHLQLPPQIGLDAGKLLVNDTSERLKLMNIVSVPSRNPATGQPASIADIQFKDTLEGAGLTTWDNFGYLILWLAAQLRRYGWKLFDLNLANSILEDAKNSYPDLISALKELHSATAITCILRGIISEQQSIRNLRLILERMLDYEYATIDYYRFHVLDDRPNSHGVLEAIPKENFSRLLAFVRSGLGNEITYKLARGTSTLVVYLLEGKIETILAQRWKDNFANIKEVTNGSYQGEDDIIINAIRSEMAHLPATAQVPRILTTLEVRPLLYELLKYDFPHLKIVAYEELNPNINIQPVARISAELES